MSLDDRSFLSHATTPRLNPPRRVVAVAPAVEPWLATDAEVQSALRLDSDADASLVTLYLKAARLHFEKLTGLALITQSLRFEFDRLPCGRRLELPVAPLIADDDDLVVTAVEYLTSEGALATLDDANYLQPRPGLAGAFSALTLANDGSWPDGYDAADVPGAFRVTVNAGFGPAGTDVPSDTRMAILILAAWFYEERLPVNVGNITSPLPHHLDALIESHRIAFLA